MEVRNGIPYYAVEANEYSKRLRAMVNQAPRSMSADLRADEANRQACLAQYRLMSDELDACRHREGKYANLTEDEHYDKLVELYQRLGNISLKLDFWRKAVTPPPESAFLSASEREEYESICKKCEEAQWEERVYGMPVSRFKKSDEELGEIHKRIMFYIGEKQRYELIRRERYYAEINRRRTEEIFGPKKVK